MKRFREGLFIAIVILFLGGCTAEQMGALISKIPGPDSGPVSQEEPIGIPVDPDPGPVTPPPVVKPPVIAKPLPSAEKTCFDLVQGKIAWDYKGTRQWSPANVQRLCKGTTNPSQPPACFNRVMHGGVNWGGGTQWNWQNAINLCEGTNNASQTIACFQNRINAKQSWQSAISGCDK